MKWFFRCPSCGHSDVWVPWEEHGKILTCPNTHKPYRVPEPANQHAAYVDTHDWPVEMERVVRQVHGAPQGHCTVPGCIRRADTLDHRLAWSKGGNTSVLNLYPMCNQHNGEKGDTPYQLWLLLTQ
jgi:hypothetical protein